MLPGIVEKRLENEEYFALLGVGILSTIILYQAWIHFIGNKATFIIPALIAGPWIGVFRHRLRIFEETEDYFKEHFKAYLFLFSGVVAGYSVLSYFYPENFEQQETIAEVSGAAFQTEALIAQIFANNFTVYLIIFLLALSIGKLGTFVICWNASVVGVVFGNMIRENPFQIIFYLPHTSIEMAGFIIAGLSGTLASSIARKNISDWDKKQVIRIAAGGLALIGIAALIETT